MRNKLVPIKRAYGTGKSIVVDKCQICGYLKLDDVVFIGYLPPVNSMPKVGSKPQEESSYPALLLKCPVCKLFQLGTIVDPKILFPPEYPYTSGTTKILRDNFTQLFGECRRLLHLDRNDLVVDIGSNDGTLLSNFSNFCRVQGVEPSNAAVLAKKRGIPTLITFFNKQAVEKIKRKQGRAKIITATNVFAHIEDVHSVMENVLDLLGEDGVFITESHYIYSLIRSLQYDTIYHEHLRYYSLQSLNFIFKKYGLSIFHAKKIPTHGGSLRVYACRNTRRQTIQTSVSRILRDEKQHDLDSKKIHDFRRKITLSKLKLYTLLFKIKKNKNRIYGIGAPSRASTLINYVGLDENIIDCVLEIHGSYKIGKYMPGTRIPVVEESLLFHSPPDYALLFSWHIADELIQKLRNKGYRGKFILPLPDPSII
ncbi:class I SAM-dependent methyltransferase [Candidatus Gottesmanbacteria bacterium]|nr:class I SAM-dependent methyltransferase [Candidatus Gottesmanbacteria bacterium]